MNKLRFKDGTGSPADVLTALDHNGLPRGLITRYRGNRLNVIFRLAWVYFQYFDLFQDLVSSRDTTLKSALRSCFDVSLFKSELQAFAIFDKVLSGPWITKFYSNASNFRYVESINIVREVIDKIESFASLLTPEYAITHDLFGNTLKDPGPGAALYSLTDTVVEILRIMMRGAVQVLMKQYKPLLSLSGSEFDKLAAESVNARQHNIDAEEVVGMFSAALNKAPSATIQYISARIRAKKNGTLEQIIEHPGTPEEFKKVIKLAGDLRSNRKAQNKSVMVEVRKRILDKKQKRTDKERGKLERKFKKLKNCQRETILTALPEYEEHLDVMCYVFSGEATSDEITHNWADEDTHQLASFKGKIGKSSGRGGNKIKYQMKDMMLPPLT